MILAFRQFFRQALLTANGCFRKLNQSGKASPLPTDQGTAFEIALDVETVHAVCQKCKIALIEARGSAFMPVSWPFAGARHLERSA